jgi:hypothetical protein
VIDRQGVLIYPGGFFVPIAALNSLASAFAAEPLLQNIQASIYPAG